MRLQIWIIAGLSSAIPWVGSFNAARDTYRAAQAAYLIPNLEIRHNIEQIVTTVFRA